MDQIYSRIRLLVVYGLVLLPFIIWGAINALESTNSSPLTGSTRLSSSDRNTTTSLPCSVPEMPSSRVGPNATGQTNDSTRWFASFENHPCSVLRMEVLTSIR